MRRHDMALAQECVMIKTYLLTLFVVAIVAYCSVLNVFFGIAVGIIPVSILIRYIGELEQRITKLEEKINSGL